MVNLGYLEPRPDQINHSPSCVAHFGVYLSFGCRSVSKRGLFFSSDKWKRETPYLNAFRTWLRLAVLYSTQCLHSIFYVNYLTGVTSGAHLSVMLERKEPAAQAMALHLKVMQLLDLEALDGFLWTPRNA